MDSRIELFLDDFDGFMELHSEYADSIGTGNFEARAVWEEIEDQFKQLFRRVARIRRKAHASEDELDELDAMMEELNEQYGELASLL